MNYRITTNGLYSQYRSQLHSSQGRLNDAMTHVETGRNFNRYYEDPGTASMAFNLRRSYWRTGDQIDNSTYVISKLQTGYSALEPVIDGTTEGTNLSTISESLRALNDATGSARGALGLEMLSVADSVMRVMNVRYNDEFVFAGADGLNVPFSFQENEDGSKTLLYRGVDVDLDKPPMPDQFGLEDMTAKDDYLLSEKEFNRLDGDGLAALKEKYTFTNYDGYKSAYQDINAADDETMAKLNAYAAARDKYMEDYAEAKYPKPVPGDYELVDHTLKSESEFEALTPAEKNGLSEKGYDLTDYDSYKSSYQTLNKLSDEDMENFVNYSILKDEVNPDDAPTMLLSKAQFEALDDTERADLEAIGYDLTDYDSYKSSVEDAMEKANTFIHARNEVARRSMEGYDHAPLYSEEEFNQLGDAEKTELEDSGYDLTSYESYKASYQERNEVSDEKMERLDAFAEARDENAAIQEKTIRGTDYRKIALRFDETVYVDIGLGMQLNDKGHVEASSAFNAAVSGLDFLGYGLDEDGDPKNLVSLMNELGTLFSKCDPKTGEYPEPAQENMERANVLTQKVRAAIDNLQNNHVALSSKVDYLDTNMNQLQDRKVTLNEQIETAEQMDPADAITAMLWAQYSYNAAMRIGNQILSQSLLDFIS